MAFYFLFIIIFGSKRVKISSLLIFTSCALILFTGLSGVGVEPRQVTKQSYINDLGNSVLWDSFLAFTLCVFIKLDSVIWKHCTLLSFATITHFMVLLYLITTSQITENLTFFFYNWYDELIIIIGLLQMAVSYNGFRGATVNAHGYIQSLLPRLRANCSGHSKSLHIQKTAKAKL